MKLTVSTAETGLRLDRWLDGRLPDLSRSRIQALLASGDITLQGSPARAHRKVKAGMLAEIRVPPPVETELCPEPIPLSVLHEDEDVIVLDKPAGLVVHPAAGHRSGTLVNALLHHCRDLGGVGGERRPGIVHRLDKDTSGVMVCAKNDLAMDGLSEQFKTGRVRKQYLALVSGCPSPLSGTVETRIGRSPRDRKKMAVRPAVASGGRRAVTHYEVTERFAGVSFLAIRIETGRTHQIRVHMAHLGHPVIGDRQYGGRRRPDLPVRADRQMLHAARLGFAHPRRGDAVEFSAPVPPDMESLLGALRTPQGA